VLSYEDAAAAVTAPGERFEVEAIEVDGIAVRAFKNAPPNLRALFDTARARGDETFLVYEDERWSFAEVMRHVDAMGALLVDHFGVTKGDRVAIGMRNYPEWVIAFAAITSIGAVSVSLNAWWTADELAYALEDSGATVLVADIERVTRAAEACARLGCRSLAVRASGDLPAGAERWEDLRQLGAELPAVDVRADDDATILYTSGTTGHPKGAVSTNRAVLQALLGFGCKTAIDRLRRPPAPDAPSPVPPVFILIVPLFHVTGCVPVMLSCFASGLKLVVMYKWDAERALELIEREGVTNFVGVPTQAWDLLESPAFATTDTSSLVSVGGGGAPAPPELVKRVASSFKTGKPNIGYGMTETNAYGPGNSGQDYLDHPTSTGRATPILELAVRDPDGHDLPTGERGEIWFKGPHLIRGYWNKPEATAETMVDGWLRSGDIGRVDAEGFVYVEDRAKDMVLRGGENVYCAEVEAAVYEHPAVYEAAVFGVPHDRLGEEVAAVVHVRPGHALDVDELRRFVGERLAPFKVPSVVRLVDAPLPRNAAGKILKRELRDSLT
jgi:long-chain acyl-CoA synthetase